MEIPKAKRLLKKDPKNKIIQWMAFLDNPNEKEVLEMAKENKDIRKAMEKLKEISKDDKLRRIAELREKAILDERSAINYATEKGREEGKAEGEKLRTRKRQNRRKNRRKNRNSQKTKRKQCRYKNNWNNYRTNQRRNRKAIKIN